MVSRVGRWSALGARSGFKGPARASASAEAVPAASLALAFEQLCAQLKRPFSSAEIRAAAPPAEAGLTAGGVLLAAERRTENIDGPVKIGKLFPVKSKQL